MSEEKESVYIDKCPFCGEVGPFDLIGLKYHLLNHCSVYHDLEERSCLFPTYRW